MGWRRSSTDPNAAIGPSLARLRDAARDLVRNNPHAESALATIADHTVGWGIFGKPAIPNQKARDVWKAWAESTDCDADGRNDFYGLQKLATRTTAESGEALVRRRIRRPEDGFKIPIQIQILEPDFVDTTKEATLPNGGVIVQGVEFDPIGRRVAYWLYREHPGSSNASFNDSVRVPADGIRHIFKQTRPGQVRAPSWFAPTLLRFRDFDDYEDATLVKQKVAACLAVIATDPDGTASPLGTPDDAQTPAIDQLSPGAILNLQPGKTIEVVQPPSVTDYDAYQRVSLRSIATGLGVAYEDLTGDYTNMPFSAARMSMLRHWARVEDWRWRMLIPQFCDPVWAWVMQVAMIMGQIDGDEIPLAEWTPPPAPMVDPVNEGLAYQRNIRTGIQSLSEALRERGLDPDDTLDELSNDFKRLDKLKLVLDCDPRNMTQAGQLQGKASAAAAPAAPPEPVKAPNPDDVDDENNEDEDDNEDDEEE